MRPLWTLFLLAASPAWAERPDRPDLELRLPAHEVEVLHLPIPDGPAVAVIADATAPVVAVATMVGGGLAAEPLEQPGIAAASADRWLASMSAGDVALGARTRAEVLPDGTLFVTEAPADALPTLLDRVAVLSSSRAAASTTEASAAGIASAVPARRWAPFTSAAAGDPRFGPLFAALWGDHPYARLGRAPASSFTDADVHAWTADRARTSVAVLGAVDLDTVAFDVLAALAPHLVGATGDRPGQRRKSALVALSGRDGVHLPRLRGRSLPAAPVPAPAAPSEASSPHVTAPTALVGWTLPAEGAVAGPLVEQASTLVTAALTRRFELDPRVDGLTCDRVAGEQGTSLVCAFTCRDAGAARAVAEAAPRTRFTRALVADTRDWHRRDLVAVLYELWEPYGARAGHLALHLHLAGGPMRTYDRLRGHDYDAIDVRRFLREWVGQGRAGRVVLLPGDAGAE